MQGIVTCMSLDEVFATGIKIFDWQKFHLIASLSPCEALDCLISSGSRGKMVAAQIVDLLILQFGGHLDPLIKLIRRTLIAF